jgi:hypothetical protein
MGGVVSLKIKQGNIIATSFVNKISSPRRGDAEEVTKEASVHCLGSRSGTDGRRRELTVHTAGVAAEITKAA